MSHFLKSVFCLLFVVVSSVAFSQESATDFSTEIDKVVAEFQEEHKVPGLGVAIGHGGIAEILG